MYSVSSMNNKSIKKLTDAEIEEYLKSPHASFAFKVCLNYRKKMRLPFEKREAFQEKRMKGDSP